MADAAARCHDEESVSSRFQDGDSSALSGWGGNSGEKDRNSKSMVDIEEGLVGKPEASPVSVASVFVVLMTSARREDPRCIAGASTSMTQA